MVYETNRRSVTHLIRQVLTRNADVPNYALLLGAGASATSGVDTAITMIEEWRHQEFEAAKVEEPFDDWIKKQDWYETDDEYSILFERAHDEPSQRRAYIEEKVKNAHPSWGYVYLTNLLANNIFNAVFTTNFDDLINEACYLYSERVRPIVAAHDSEISNIRITPQRPKIIKLHGDFLYDNIKNTKVELDRLESGTRKKLAYFAAEYGLVVVGYSGRDSSVMDALTVLAHDEEYFPHGIYWCVRSAESPSKRLRGLLAREKVYVVETEGFDELMADLHEQAALPLPQPLAQPYRFATERARLFVDKAGIVGQHPIIERDSSAVLRDLNRIPQDLDERVPPTLMALIYRQEKNNELAYVAIEKAIAPNQMDSAQAAQLYAQWLIEDNRHDDLVAFIDKTDALSEINKTYFLLRIDENEEVIALANAFLSPTGVGDSEDSDFIRINRAIAYRRRGMTAELEMDLAILDAHDQRARSTWHFEAGIAALSHDKERLMRALPQAFSKAQLTRAQFMIFPVFEEYREDDDILRLVNGRRNRGDH